LEWTHNYVKSSGGGELESIVHRKHLSRIFSNSGMFITSMQLAHIRIPRNNGFVIVLRYEIQYMVHFDLMDVEI